MQKIKINEVSIHAHVRWATVAAGFWRDLDMVSIHAHVRWATQNGGIFN